MTAERDTNDRYLAAYLSERVGEEFTGRVSGVARFGAFVRLDETGADGLIPVRALGREFFHFDRDAGTLMGADTGLTIGLGQRVTVRLSEAAPVTGGIALDLISIDGKAVQQGQSAKRGKSRGKPVKRKPARAAKKDAKVKRKVKRSRR